MGTPRTGKKIANYLICEQIGGGAMGRVWRGIDEALGRAVAIKMLRTELADHPELIERFRVEAQALARLNHPNIATVFALAEEDDELFLVMEYVQGETLHALLERRGALPFDACFPLFHQALDGIQHAHDAGVVHRDIKASNLMLDLDGQAKWIDFGIARLDGRGGSTRTGGLMGTPEYMAPEQVRGEAGTIQSDIYSLGVFLYKLLTGRSPFAGRGEFEVMRAHVETAPPRPSELGADVGDALEGVLLRALDKDPTARFPSARAFQEALVEAGAPDRVSTTLPPVPSSEITLCDAGAPLEPTRPDVDDLPEGDERASVRGVGRDALGSGIEPESPTLIMSAPRSGRSRLALWVGAAILMASAAFALDWIAASSDRDVPPPVTGSASAPAEAGATPANGADGSIASDPAAPEPDSADAANVLDSPEPSPGKPSRNTPGWKIVR